jgi:hypothetical protein
MKGMENSRLIAQREFDPPGWRIPIAGYALLAH